MWSYPPRKILVAVDFGEAAAAAVRVAGELARKFDAELTAVHTESFEAPPYFTREQITAIEKQRRAARKEAQRYVQRFSEPLAQRPVTAVVSEIAPAEGILDAARGHDLIVMGTHGRRGPARWWAGSVAERVVREAEVPVLVVRGSDGANAAEVFARVSVIAGTATFAGGARRYATGLAEAFGGALTKEDQSTIRPAALRNASLVVLSQPAVKWPHVFSGPAERALRECHRPLLFVPTT
jgi:nucleotide-binding universal stress UspA family protein